MSVTGTNISLTLRNVKGSELTYSELDGNQSNLKTGIENHSHNEFSLTTHNHTGTYEPANSNIQSHISSTSNPHSVTAAQAGADPVGTAAGLVSTHASSSDHDGRYYTETETNSLLSSKQNTSEKGQALGYCPLDGSIKIAEAYLPDSVLGQVEYQGTWNATTNTPAIPAASSTNKGWYYIVAVSGTTTVDAISEWTIGDWIISNGTAWAKVDNTDSVSSVFGRAGTIVANSGDYTASQVTNVPQGNIAAITVQAAINELDSEKAATTDSRFVTNGDSHDHVGGDGAAISLTTAVSGVLPVAKGGTGSSSLGSEKLLVTNTGGTAVNTVGSTIVGQVLLSAPTGGPSFGALPLGNSNAVSGMLPVSNGGTGSSTQNFVDLTTNQTVSGDKTFSSPVVVPAGTAALPALTTAGDTNTGVHFPAADTVGIATGGLDALRFYAIDSASSAITQTTADGSDTKRLQLAGGGSTGNTRGAYINLHGNEHATFPGVLTLLSGNTGTDYINFWTANSERARITSSGFFGIGNTAPNALLDVKTPNTTANEVVAQFGNYNITGGLQIRTTDGNLVWDLNALNSRNLTFSTNQTERARITSAGAVLVGRTSETLVPKLQVGFGNPAASPAYTSNVDIAVFNALGAGVLHVQAPATSGIGFSSDTVRSAGYIGYSHSTNTMEFRTNTTAKMSLTSDGKQLLGYSTSQGDYLLQVNGSGLLNKVIIGTSTDPGYTSNLHVAGGMSFANVANANSRVLDWYEEGTFTPVVVGATTAGTGTYTVQVGRFTRIGRNVTIQIQLTWAAHTGTGVMTVTGLPFTNITSTAAAALAVSYDGLTIGAGKQLTAYIGSGTSSIVLAACDPAGGAVSAVSIDSAVNLLLLSGTYFVP